MRNATGLRQLRRKPEVMLNCRGQRRVRTLHTHQLFEHKTSRLFMIERTHWASATTLLADVLKMPRVGIVSDFDGTLSSFTARADDAVIAPVNAQAIDALLPLITVFALVSGRAADDVYQRFNRPSIVYYGNHGLESFRDGKLDVTPQAQPWELPLKQLLTNLDLPPIPGIYVENKRVTASVHYRQAENPGMASSQIEHHLRPLVERYGLLLAPGNHIWEIRPPVLLNKGSALHSIILHSSLDGVIFLGDDETDITAMQMLTSVRASYQSAGRDFKGVSVGVIHTEGSPTKLLDACDVVANSPDDVGQLLSWAATYLQSQSSPAG